IDYPDAILNRRMSAQECWDAADECGAPMVAIPGGEPLIHKDIGEIVRGLVDLKKFVSLCTNPLLFEKKLHVFKPTPSLPRRSSLCSRRLPICFSPSISTGLRTTTTRQCHRRACSTAPSRRSR